MRPTVTYSYKHLTGSDVGTLKELLRVFGEVFQEPHTYQGAVPGDEYLHALLSRPHFIVVVALAQGTVIGGLAAYVLEKFEQERSEIYVYDLAVLENHRRKGVATALMNELRHIAARRGAYVVFIQADQGDTPAIRLYESLGKREDVCHFDIAVN
jgi:aminoglycoside 3-N-acetyltransferase I